MGTRGADLLHVAKAHALLGLGRYPEAIQNSGPTYGFNLQAKDLKMPMTC